MPSWLSLAVDVDHAACQMSEGVDRCGRAFENAIELHDASIVWRSFGWCQTGRESLAMASHLGR